MHSVHYHSNLQNFIFTREQLKNRSKQRQTIYSADSKRPKKAQHNPILTRDSVYVPDKDEKLHTFSEEPRSSIMEYHNVRDNLPRCSERAAVVPFSIAPVPKRRQRTAVNCRTLSASQSRNLPPARQAFTHGNKCCHALESKQKANRMSRPSERGKERGQKKDARPLPVRASP